MMSASSEKLKSLMIKHNHRIKMAYKNH